MKRILRQHPLFLFLLPVFFVLHGCLENYPFIPFTDAALLTLIYIAAAFLIGFLAWLFLRNIQKAALFSFALMSFHFFFGSMRDALLQVSFLSFMARYTILLPAAGLFFTGLFILLKKRKKPFEKLPFFLNLFFLLIITLDGILLSGKTAGISSASRITHVPQKASICDTCAKPDIYFILLDEYAGHKALKDLFGFDNTAFEDELRSRGFQVVPNSHSNYNYTPFSVASTLNMSYLTLKDTNRTSTDLTYTYQTIQNSEAIRFFTDNGYRFYNYSVFDFEGQPARTRETFLPARTRLITSQTFLSQAEKNIFFHLVTRLRSKSASRRLTYLNLNNNRHLYELTKQKAKENASGPKLVYTHLMMPHYPYYFDKDGKPLPMDALQEGKQVDKAAYISYLQYANREILALVDHIRENATHPPLIMLLSDHGFRHFEQAVSRPYYFLNLMALSLPGKNYTGFNEGFCNSNLFRQVLNNQFGQQLPLLNDSTIYLKD